MRTSLLLLALASIGCGLTGPSDDLTGTWIAQGPGHSTLFGFTLLQTDDTISGTACSMFDGRVGYRDVPVTGDYPHLQFAVSASTQFTGKQDGSKDIVGTYGTFDLRFERSQTDLCQTPRP